MWIHLVSLGLIDGAGGAAVAEETYSGGYEYANRAPRRRTDDEIREARVRFGVLEALPAAAAPVAAALEAKSRALASVDTTAKLAAARAQMEAEEAYKRIYQAVYEDIRREDLAELFRLEVAEKQKLRRRRAAMLLLTVN